MHTKLYIAGEDIDGAKQAIRLNPVSGAAATVYAAAGVSEADAAAKAAGRAFEPWSKTGIGVRRAILNKAADELEARQGDIVEAIVAETGATSPRFQ